MKRSLDWLFRRWSWLTAIEASVVLLLVSVSFLFDDGVSRTWQIGTSIEDISISPDGTLLAVAELTHTVALRRVPDGEVLHTLDEHTDAVVAVAFSPDNRMLASASQDDTVRVWQVETGQLVATLPVTIEVPAGVAFSPDGRLLATGTEFVIELWDTTSWRLQTRLAERGYRPFFSADGKYWLLAEGMSCASGSSAI